MKQRYEIRNDEVVARKLGTETVALQLESGLYYGFDEVGSAIWERLAAGESMDEIRAGMLSVYEVEPAVLERDLERIIQEMEEKCLIREAGTL
jgi:hypothetical protein